jgi:hypothetical protein
VCNHELTYRDVLGMKRVFHFFLQNFVQNILHLNKYFASHCHDECRKICPAALELFRAYRQKTEGKLDRNYATLQTCLEIRFWEQCMLFTALYSPSLSLLCTFSYWGSFTILHYRKKKLHGLSSRTKYTDRATASCRRSDCQLLRIEGATWWAWRIPAAVVSIFETGAATFLSSSSSVVLTRLSGPRSWPTILFFFLVVSGIEPGPPDL